MQPVNVRRITLTALMAALVFALTMLRIPLAVTTGGYIHLGDAAITFAAAAFSPWVAAAAGGLGTALADLIGYPQWAPFSLIVHGVQGALMGLLLWRKQDVGRFVAAAVVSILVIVGGYYVAGVILVGPATAALEIIPNIIQGLSGSVIGIPLYLAVRRAYPNLGAYREV